MKLLISVLLSFLAIISTFANSNEIGKIIKLKGSVTVARANEVINLKIDEKILKNDLVKTKKKSFLKIEFKDKTTIVIGPNSEIKVEKFTLEKGSIFNLIKGQFRTKVNKKVTKDNAVVVKTNLASLAIRGTEFLTNSYLVNSKSVTDTALLEGSIQTTVKDSPSFMLNQSEAFNTNQLAQGQPVSKLSPESVKSLMESPDSLLPNIQNVDGGFNNINDLIKKNFSLSAPSPSGIIAATAGVATAIALGGDDNEAKPTPVKIEKKKEKNKKELNLALLPWSIRDAILRREDLLEANECFYWFFKSIPGGGEKELFRRERDCNEFDNDL